MCEGRFGSGGGDGEEEQASPAELGRAKIMGHF
jgi:hypothetical protein